MIVRQKDDLSLRKALNKELLLLRMESRRREAFSVGKTLYEVCHFLWI